MKKKLFIGLAVLTGLMSLQGCGVGWYDVSTDPYDIYTDVPTGGIPPYYWNGWDGPYGPNYNPYWNYGPAFNRPIITRPPVVRPPQNVTPPSTPPSSLAPSVGGQRPGVSIAPEKPQQSATTTTTGQRPSLNK